MDAERQRRLEELFAAAADLEPAEQSRLLADRCSDDPELSRELREMLEEDAAGTMPAMRSPLRRGAADAEGAGAFGVVAQLGAGDSFGRYRIVREIGQGGMGTVYEAEQDTPRRTIALKVLRSGIGATSELRRFELEAEVLGRLSHSGIARVYDAGTAEHAGGCWPFLAMELIDGVPVTTWAARRESGVRERLELLARVCDAVEHAHEKGVIHRDLKPGNILVETSGQPRVLDFGIARVTGQDPHATMRTNPGEIIGTLAYMSPEQAAGDAAEIDTRSDVYALGVIAYELLAGRRPHELSGLTLHEAVRVIAEDDSEPLGNCDTELRGDVATIVHKALEKEKARRYGSAAALAADVRRFLRHEPITARPTTTIYQLRKFARRHRVLVGGIAATILALMIGLVSTLLFAFESLENEARARRESDRFNSVSVAVKLERAEAAREALQPAWPNKIAALEKWLREEGEPLAEELGLVRETLRELAAKALPDTENTEQDPTAHPDYERIQKLARQVDALQYAMDVRTKKCEAEAIEVPAGTPSTAAAINDLAWGRVAHDPEERLWGEEALGLALARRAVAIAEHRRAVYLGTLSWACFANGLDAEAKMHSQAALDAAPESAKADLRRAREKLNEAIATAPKALADARAALARLRRTWRFESLADDFLHATMRSAERDLLEYRSPTGTLAEMRSRLRWARRLDTLTREHPNARTTWAAAADAIAKADGAAASELYSAKYHPDHAVRLQPQIGLVPIGVNPRTLLWEFYHLRSAWDPWSGVDPATIEIPAHADDGSIEVTAATGIVFVLLPGGTFTMGAQKTDPKGTNFDEQAEPDETPREVTVAPFFLARHELTQGQWLRLSLQANPSRSPGDGEQSNWVGGKVTLAHPVEQLGWDLATKVLAAHGLLLPEEAQWEYGCRAGTSTPWFPGRRESDLRNYANILDATAKRGAPSWWGKNAEFDDGHLIHAPVGTYEPNAFGLYDVHGNVWEWCQDLHPPADRAIRGGSYILAASRARCADHAHGAATIRLDYLGCRASRPRF